MIQQFSRVVVGGAFSLLVAWGVSGCEETEPSGQSSTSGTASSSSGSGSSSSGGTGGMGGGGGGGMGGGTASNEYAALVRGTLFTADMAMAKMKHDEVAAGGEAEAKAAGDIAHDALLGTKLLGTTENTFLGLDRWTDAAAMDAFYKNPAIQMAFGQLFAMPPVTEAFQRQPTWHTWGDMNSGDTFTPYFFVIARGHLKEADPKAAQMAHDTVAAAGEAQAMAAGDVAHIVFTGLQDPREFLAVDIWKDSTNLEALYTNPDFQMAFGSLFDAMPTVGVYSSTDWHQW